MADLALPSTTIDVAHGCRWRSRSCAPPLAGTRRPRRVVDLGCGTGLSTRFWAPHADEVVGVEPNDAMRAFAETATESHNIRYIGASAYQTGLADAQTS